MRIEELYQIYVSYPRICTDSRKIEKDSLFFALKGESFNGNAYAHLALQSGACYAIIDEKEFQLDERFILVENVLACLQDLAHYHRQQIGAKVIALTGSNGKTSTKELMAAVLGSTYKIHATSGNFNNHIGVPLTLLNMPTGTEYAIIEMGANHQKEIEMLCKIAAPDFGLITNVGKAHLEGFGGFEGVMKGKGEMYDYIQAHQGCIFINSGNQHLAKMSVDVSRQISYGIHPSDFVSGKITGSEPFLDVEWKRQNGQGVYKIHSQMPGVYNLENILAAVCVGVYFGVEEEKICRAIEGYKAVNNRSQVIQKGSNTILADAYNANPSSMEAALHNFFETVQGDKILIIGDMMELGVHADEEHKKLLLNLKNSPLKQVILVGENFRRHAELIDAVSFLNTAEALDWLKKQHYENTTFLIKGSRKMQLEKAIDFL